MQIAPHTKDEWISLLILPAKVFFLAFVLIVASKSPIEYRWPSLGEFLTPCFYWSGTFLLFGALVQAIVCRRGSATRTLVFIGVVSLGANFGFGVVVALAMGWLVWRLIYSNENRPAVSDEPIECMDCHAAISAGESRCSKCGWTFMT